MPNVSWAARFRAAAMVFMSLIAVVSTPATAQTFSGNPYDPTRVFGYSSRGLIELAESASSIPDSWEHTAGGPATVSSDILRHPLNSKARRRLQKALQLSEIGEHPAAIRELRETLVKEPSAAPYAQNFLGIEYVENRQFDQARTSFEEAVRLMPHESVNHSNLGFSLVVAGDLNAAEQEARTAIQLDPLNTKAKTLLDLLLHARKLH